MKVLVTGANGFLGSSLTKKLVEMKCEVRVLARPSSDLSEIENLNYELYHGDITSLADVEKACADCELVFHLAGVVAYTKQQRQVMEDVNIGGTANVLKAVQKNNVSRLLHVSSVTAIGASFDGTPLNEKSEFNISHLNLGYFETKKSSEELVKKACDQGLVDAVIVNPSTIYGSADAKKGSRKMQVKCAQGKLPISSPGGVNIVSVEAVVDGILKAVERGQTGERYILAGENITIEELFRIIAEEAGSTPPKMVLPKPVILGIGRLGSALECVGLKGPLSAENAWTAVLFHWFENDKAKKELGFTPGTARDAIRNSVQWMKESGVLELNK